MQSSKTNFRGKETMPINYLQSCVNALLQPVDPLNGLSAPPLGVALLPLALTSSRGCRGRGPSLGLFPALAGGVWGAGRGAPHAVRGGGDAGGAGLEPRAGRRVVHAHQRRGQAGVNA